ncbi:MAG: hypothetical protein OXL40_13585 [Bacteroidota bacterium]|nr:hypothetical protein [Bacteroidota bacterium]
MPVIVTLVPEDVTGVWLLRGLVTVSNLTVAPPAEMEHDGL